MAHGCMVAFIYSTDSLLDQVNLCDVAQSENLTK